MKERKLLWEGCSGQVHHGSMREGSREIEEKRMKK